MHKTIVKYIKGYVARDYQDIIEETLTVRFTHDRTGESISIALENCQNPVMLAVPFEPVARIIEESRRK